MPEMQVRMVVLSTGNIDSAIQFYSEGLGMPLKFRDGDRYAAMDGGSVTIALATDEDHPLPGHVVVGIKAADVDRAAMAIAAAGGRVLRAPYNDLHERRAVACDKDGNGIVLYGPLPT